MATTVNLTCQVFLEMTAGLACKCTGEAAAAHPLSPGGRWVHYGPTDRGSQHVPCKRSSMQSSWQHVCSPHKQVLCWQDLVVCTDGPVFTSCIVLSDNAGEHFVQQWKATGHATNCTAHTLPHARHVCTDTEHASESTQSMPLRLPVRLPVRHASEIASEIATSMLSRLSRSCCRPLQSQLPCARGFCGTGGRCGGCIKLR